MNFVYQGAFAPTGASPWWTQLTGLDRYPTAEPILGYPRLQKVGDNWIMAIWYSNNPGGSHEYTYNTVIWDLGNSPGNLQGTQIGPLNDNSGTGSRPKGPGGNHVGTFGIIRDAEGVDTLYLRGDMREPASSPGGGLGRYGLHDGVLNSLPITVPVGGGTQADVADLFTGTDFCWWNLTADRCTALGLGPTPAYVDNYGRTLADGATLHTYYSMDANPPGRPGAKQLFHITSRDNGVTWTTAAKLFTPDGSKVTVDGLRNTGNFSRPEVVPLGDGSYRSYFSTFDACGKEVMVTAMPADMPGPTMTITKKFEPNEVAVNSPSTLTVTVKAPTVSCGEGQEPVKYTGISYTDNLPAGVVVDSANTAGNLCGGTLMATAGAASFTVSGFTLAAGASCTTTLKVKPTQVGSFLNTIYKSPEGAGGLDNDQGVPAAENATDTLRTPGAPGPVTVAPVPTLGEISLGLLGLLMAGWGARRLRRRQG